MVPFERIWSPADAIRLRFLRGFVHTLGETGRRLVVDRALRVSVTATFAVMLAFAFTATIPMWMLALGPIVLGVPHVIGDVRYLVLRRGHHRRKLLVILCGGPLIAAWVDARVLMVFVACAGALLVAHTSHVRRAVGLVVVAALGVAAWYWGYWADLAFAHLHNLIGVSIWLLWAPRTGRSWMLPVLAYALVATLILLGALDPLSTNGTLDVSWTGLTLDTHTWSLAPGLDGPWPVRLVLLFAFAQSIHYWVWIRLVPEEDRGRTTPRSFRASWRALYHDLGPVLLFGAIAAAVFVAGWAFIDVANARSGYLRMAIFHGQIELVALTLFFAEGRPGPLKRRAEALIERG